MNKYNVNDYLLNCDNLNKFNIKNIYTKPFISKIVLTFPLKNLYSSADILQNNVNIQIKSILLYYLIFSLQAHINFNKQESIKLSKKVVDGDYSLKVEFNSARTILDLLLFTLEKKSEIKNSNFLKEFKNLTFAKKLILNSKDYFLFNFISKSILKLNSFDFNIYFIFKNVNTNFFSKNLYKNIYFFL